MDLDISTHTNIMFLQGCFLDDCDTIEDLFDEKLMHECNTEHKTYDIESIQYDKIQPKFVNITLWSKHTNIKCWMCDCSFQTVPIFIPSTIDKDTDNTEYIGVIGNFCSWECASLHINLYFNADERWEKHLLLLHLHKIFTGKQVDEIVPAFHKTAMVQYGGDKTVNEFREQLSHLNNNYNTAILHNSIDQVSKEFSRRMNKIC
jgi:hypothetical protein